MYGNEPSIPSWIDSTFRIVYAPLFWLSDVLPEVQEFFQWYLESCVALMGG